MDHDEEGLFVLATAGLWGIAQNMTNSDEENRQETLGMTDKGPHLYLLNFLTCMDANIQNDLT